MAVGDSKESEDGLPVLLTMFTRWLPASLSMLIPPVKTGPDGRFQLRGAGRERIVSIADPGPQDPDAGRAGDDARRAVEIDPVPGSPAGADA